MALTSDDTPVVGTTAVVTIRIPCGTDSALVTDAEERLTQPTGIDDVTIDELHNIEPKLSATVITVSVAVRLTSPMSDTELREELADVPGLGSVERLC